ncbi:MFS transporter [Actinomadura sp. BRA 177]|uniref:MFS transporter n=1 Tax=Actinomadura sp. BRA 177 TaxID=2745202 RepID=UPI001595713A|nr:MFS transporter [Actinomadura sp. BRA 177]NVI91117.1 hypothetical protein [Actinomadura sp. BRA 177]
MSTAPPTPSARIIAFPGRPPIPFEPARAAPFGWWPAICIALVALIDRIEANLMAGALPRIQEEFGFSETAGGAIASAAALAGVVLLLARRPHPADWTIAAVVAVWSLLTVGSGLAQSYATLLAIRVFLGGGASLQPVRLLLRLRTRPRVRAGALRLLLRVPAGIMAGGALAQAFGWRTIFFLVAVPGVVIALLCLTVREPVRGLGDRIEAMRSGTPRTGAAGGDPRPGRRASP